MTDLIKQAMDFADKHDPHTGYMLHVTVDTGTVVRAATYPDGSLEVEDKDGCKYRVWVHPDKIPSVALEWL